MSLFRNLLCGLAIALTSCMAAPAAPPVAQRATANDPFVIAANPLAAQAGLNVLKRGGSAVDAAIAVQAMLSLVEPQSSGIGGGAFMTYYDAKTRHVVVYDGREVAPRRQHQRCSSMKAAGRSRSTRQWSAGARPGFPGLWRRSGLRTWNTV